MGPNIQSNMRIIDKVHKKIKNLLDHLLFDMVLWIALILFLILGSFSLGMYYQQQREAQKYPVEVGYSQHALDVWNTYQSEKNKYQAYFASKSGTIVYPVGCSKGNRIKQENRIYFDTVDEAVTEGYREVEGC